MPTSSAAPTLLLCAFTLAWSQTAESPRFEVASIKPSSTGLPRTDFQGVGSDRFTARAASLKRLISIGFRVYDHQIAGGPNWMDSALFDVEAKASGPMSLSEMERRVQTLLADRCKLAFHREMREQPVLEMVVVRNGPKLGPADDTRRNYFREGSLTAHNADVDFLARSLTYLLGKNVINKTGIEGRHSYELKWTLEDTTGARDGVSLFSAIQEQLGLKLEARKGQVEVLVVDHVEKPSDN